ncbi:hypothetical protein SPRG_10141 [Saprolegnia parasitica CBS 223.65]|uniref:RING-type domain-containing protein n=1 Tax=Saprolegnia parasitica (strain CBS 223.65) TaxID=695850 RepID=A0A067C1G0_SAPPC|nr:hypothetical protein SPRG_10141 [Saprolegnia parasitica CBS 223.65]KDO24609.1 hypothetical protein SPRG_10141 [Saprolegnia parasitica CBS 223.65]|eukprot:XP_012204677.1 hypothetical protein SPRG_10141 [Saprolegnia parasitica CBS 223.65]
MADDADAWAADRRQCQRYAFFSCAAGAVALASTYERCMSATCGSLEAIVELAVKSKPSVLALLNVYMLCLYAVFHAASPLVFGAVRLAEVGRVREHMLQFLVLRCILLLNTLGSVGFHAMLRLVLWMSMLTLLHATLTLLRLRLSYAGLADRATGTILGVTLGLLLGLLLASWHVFAAASSVLCLLTCTEALLALVKWAHTALLVLGPRLERDLLLLKAQFILDVTHLVGLLAQYMGVLSLGGFRVSFLDFVLVMNVKRTLSKAQGRLAEYYDYAAILSELSTALPDVSIMDEHGEPQVCAICLAPLCVAKQLECGHVFHLGCLRQCFQEQMRLDKPWQCALCRKLVARAHRTPWRAHRRRDMGDDASIASLFSFANDDGAPGAT